jgi:hypothetical protein
MKSSKKKHQLHKKKLFEKSEKCRYLRMFTDIIEANDEIRRTNSGNAFIIVCIIVYFFQNADDIYLNNFSFFVWV